MPQTERTAPRVIRVNTWAIQDQSPVVPLCPSIHSCTTHVSNSPNWCCNFSSPTFGLSLSVFERNRNCAVFSLPERNQLKVGKFCFASWVQSFQADISWPSCVKVVNHRGSMWQGEAAPHPVGRRIKEDRMERLWSHYSPEGHGHIVLPWFYLTGPSASCRAIVIEPRCGGAFTRQGLIIIRS